MAEFLGALVTIAVIYVIAPFFLITVWIAAGQLARKADQRRYRRRQSNH